MSYAALATLVGAAACAEQEREERAPETSVGSKAQAINHGSANSTADYAVRINSGTCTGVLVTPRWVLTANHCITGHHGNGPAVPESFGGGIDGDYTIEILPAGADDVSDAGVQVFSHTNDESGDVPVFESNQLELALHDGAQDPAKDLALIRLDTRVPVNFVRPLHVPLLGTPACPSTMGSATIIGFAGASERLSKTAGEWERDVVGSWGAIFSKPWNLDVLTTTLVAPHLILGIGSGVAYANYSGIEGGDSGGPLVYGSGDSTRLCGIASNVYIADPYLDDNCVGVNFAHGIIPPVVPCAAVGNRFAAVNSVQALDFFREHLVRTDAHGNDFFDGECIADPTSDADADGDNLVDACDVCPNDADEDDQRDFDDDGRGDACDNCWTTWNSAQQNQDGDWFGDACDPCPHDPPLDELDAYGDADHDGVCNGDDNCPRAPNANQKNTNELSESVRSPASVWGDACDPVPTPRTKVTPTSEVWMEVDNHYMKGRIYDVTENKFKLTPQPSRSWPEGDIEVDIGKVRTEFRFCQPGPSHSPPFCDDVAALDDSQLRPDLTPATETPDLPYHRISLSSIGNGVRGGFATYSYGCPDNVHCPYPIKFTWDYNADAAFWKANNVVNVPCPTAVDEPGVCLEGLLWVHAATAAGGTVNVGTGLHATEIANTHIPVDVRYFSGSIAALAQEEFWFWYDMKWLPRWPDFEHVLLGRDERLFTPVDSALEGVLVSKAAQEELRAPGRRWLTAVESNAKMGKQAPAAVALNASTGAIEAALFVNDAGKGLVSQQDFGTPIAPSPSPRSAPPKLDGAFALYSRAQRAVFVLGARENPGAVWRSASGTSNAWTQIPASAPLGRVVTATSSFVDGRIHGIDEISVGGRLHARLFALDPNTGRLHVTGQWPRQNRFAKLALGLDVDGSLLLTAASATSHVIVHLGLAGGTTRAIGRVTGAGTPLAPVFATGDGYVVHFQDAKRVTSTSLESVDVDQRIDLGAVGAVL